MSYMTETTVHLSPVDRKKLDYIREHVPEMENEKDGHILWYALNELCSQIEEENKINR